LPGMARGDKRATQKQKGRGKKRGGGGGLPKKLRESRRSSFVSKEKERTTILQKLERYKRFKQRGEVTIKGKKKKKSKNVQRRKKAKTRFHVPQEGQFARKKRRSSKGVLKKGKRVQFNKRNACRTELKT